jgi:DNA-binding response OmpR family regulator
MKHRVLLVEDDEKLGQQVVDSLRGAGYDAQWLKDGRLVTPDTLQGLSLLVLDLMLPGSHGLDVLKRLRKDSDVPVLIVSARNETTDKVRALELGADDYLTKPFWPEELLARVAARLRRPVLQRSGTVQLGALAIDLDQRRGSWTSRWSSRGSSSTSWPRSRGGRAPR